MLKTMNKAGLKYHPTRKISHGCMKTSLFQDNDSTQFSYLCFNFEKEFYPPNACEDKTMHKLKINSQFHENVATNWFLLAFHLMMFMASPVKFFVFF